jgi:hypothetical protein
VFLALVIGVAMGSTVISKATVDGLRSNVKRVETRIDSTEAQNRVLQSRLSAFEKQNAELSDQMVSRTVADSLLDMPVLMIASKGIDQASLDQARTTLVDAGARFDGTLLVDDRLALTGTNATKLGQLLDANPKQDVRTLLIDRLATVLTDAAEPASSHRRGTSSTTTTTRRSATTTTARVAGSTTSTPSSTTTTVPPTSGVSQPPLITALRAGGYLGFKPPEGGSPDDLVLTTQGYHYVVVSGPTPNVPDDQFLLPLLKAMAAHGPTTVVAASAASGDNEVADRVAFVGPIRADATMNARISTVDDLERFSGLVALTFAVYEVPNNHGHYGFGKGADALLPPPPP